jgi:hypothetical protein
MSAEQELVEIKKKLDDIKTKQIESATRLKNLEEDKKKLLNECTELGVDPKGIDEALKAKQKEIDTLITEVKNGLEQFNVINT